MTRPARAAPVIHRRRYSGARPWIWTAQGAPEGRSEAALALSKAWVTLATPTAMDGGGSGACPLIPEPEVPACLIQSTKQPDSPESTRENRRDSGQKLEKRP